MSYDYFSGMEVVRHALKHKPTLKPAYCQVPKMPETLENFVKVLRKAVGKTQQEFAEDLGCGYSTLQGYEAGRAMPKDVRAKLVTIALEHNLGPLAAAIAKEGMPDENSAGRPSQEDRRQVHLLVDAILDRANPATIEALRSVLKLCELHIIGLPTRAHQKGGQ